MRLFIINDDKIATKVRTWSVLIKINQIKENITNNFIKYAQHIFISWPDEHASCYTTKTKTFFLSLQFPKNLETTKFCLLLMTVSNFNNKWLKKWYIILIIKRCTSSTRGIFQIIKNVGIQLCEYISKTLVSLNWVKLSNFSNNDKIIKQAGEELGQAE